MYITFVEIRFTISYALYACAQRGHMYGDTVMFKNGSWDMLWTEYYALDR